MLNIAIDTNTSGDTVLVSPPSGRKVRVLAYVLVAADVVTVKFTDESSDLTGAMPLAANGGVSSPEVAGGLFETALGEDLELNLSDGVQVSGHVTYELVF